METSQPHLILMITDTKSQDLCDVTMEDGRKVRLIGIMLCESFDIFNQGKKASVLAVGGLAIASEWRGMGLVVSLMKRGASRVGGDHMHLFNLKKDRKLFPCAQMSVWWYPLNPPSCLRMTIFKMDPAPHPDIISELCDRVTEENSQLSCRPMTYQDVGIVLEMLETDAKNYSLARSWTSEHVRSILPKKDVQFSYIVTDDAGKKNLDFFSFHITSYCVPKIAEVGIQKEEVKLSSAEETFLKCDKDEDTTEIRFAVPSYITSKQTNKEAMVKFVMFAAKKAKVDFIHGYGAFGYDDVFKNLGFIKNENEIHYLQMLNWESRSFKGDEIGLAWIQF